MINDPKDIQEVLKVIDNVTKEQLDEAVRRADEMNEEKRIKNIEEILELYREELPYNEDISATLDCEDLKSLEYLYKMYHQEKEKNKKLEEDIKVCEIMKKSHKKEIDQLILKLNKSLEVIDLMAEDLKKNVDVLFDTNKNIEDVKEYYFNKAKEKQDDK